MTEKAAHVYIVRPVGDGSDDYEIVHKVTGEQRFRGPEWLANVKKDLYVDYDALDTRQTRGERRKRER
jgi:hypothetical protein